MAQTTSDPSTTPTTPITGAPAVTTPTPGYKTTEFWLSLLATLLSAVYASGIVVANGTVDHAIALIAMVLAPLGYTVNRGVLKAAHAKVVALIAVLLLVPAVNAGCGGPSASTRLHAGEQAFSTCAGADLTQMVGSGSGAEKAENVFYKVLGIVEAGLANWAAELDTIAVAVGDATMACVMDAIEAFLTPPAVAAGSGSGAATAEPDPRLLRVRSYKAKLHVRMKLAAAGVPPEAVDALATASSVVDQALALVGSGR